MNLSAKNALLNFGWTIEQYEDADFYRLNEIMLAKEKKDRVVDASTLF